MIVAPKVHAQDNQDNAGINLTPQCLNQGNCGLDIYKTLQIRTDTQSQNTAEFFIQDAILGGTFFVGTMATFGILISGLMMVFGGASEKMFDRGKRGLKYSFIGLLLVIFSYTIIRMIQFIAQGQN